MKFQIKHFIDGTPVMTETTDILTWCASNNVAVTGLARDDTHRPELDGLPTLSGYTGPFLRGKCVRYIRR
jgi:hypothetical protein